MACRNSAVAALNNQDFEKQLGSWPGEKGNFLGILASMEPSETQVLCRPTFAVKGMKSLTMDSSLCMFFRLALAYKDKPQIIFSVVLKSNALIIFSCLGLLQVQMQDYAEEDLSCHWWDLRNILTHFQIIIWGYFRMFDGNYHLLLWLFPRSDNQ